MAFVDWPSSPTVGQEYEFDGNTWVYTSTGAWRKLVLAGQVATIWIRTGTLVDIVENWTPIISDAWEEIDYV
jgi:hypothetical protein